MPRQARMTLAFGLVLKTASPRIPCMRRSLYLMCAFVEAVVLSCMVLKSSAQVTIASNASHEETVLSKLSAPVYPPLASGPVFGETWI